MTGRARGWALPSAIGLVALVARMVPVMLGGGLFGLGNYDDGVYFASAVAASHGLVPYRDFLLLHPPGIVLVLLPFAALGHVTGSAVAFAVARVAFMVLGALNAMLVVCLLRRLGATAAVAGGLVYAVGLPAVFIGQSTLLETPASTCLLLCVALVPRPRAGQAWWAGVLLGASAGIKIWNVVVCLVVVLHSLVTQGWRRGLRLGLGVVIGASAVCLPFLLLSGPAMWRMVVLDQLARGGSDAPAWRRASDIVGLSAWQPHLVGWSSATVAVAAVVLACCALACRVDLGRLSVSLLVAATSLLLTTPSWYLHYAGLAAAPLALTIGSAAPALARWPSLRRPVAIAAVVALAAVWATPGLMRPFGRPFPAAELTAAVQHQEGCVTSDDPTTLIELGVFDRNLSRHCPVVVDLTGYSYDLRDPKGPRLTRRANVAWQEHVLVYLGGGRSSVVVRLSHKFSLSAKTARVLQRWRVIGAADGFAVRRPAS